MLLSLLEQNSAVRLSYLDAPAGEVRALLVTNHCLQPGGKQAMNPQQKVFSPSLTGKLS